VYDCSNAGQSDNFVKATKEISEYVGSELKYGSDARLAIQNLSLPILDEPDDPATDATRGTQIRIWEKKVDKFVKSEKHTCRKI
jgi:hypothetical protein